MLINNNFLLPDFPTRSHVTLPGISVDVSDTLNYNHTPKQSFLLCPDGLPPGGFKLRAGISIVRANLFDLSFFPNEYYPIILGNHYCSNPSNEGQFLLDSR